MISNIDDKTIRKHSVAFYLV